MSFRFETIERLHPALKHQLKFPPSGMNVQLQEKNRPLQQKGPLDTKGLQEWNTSIIVYMNTVPLQQMAESVLEKTNRSWADLCNSNNYSTFRTWPSLASVHITLMFYRIISHNVFVCNMFSAHLLLCPAGAIVLMTSCQHIWHGCLITHTYGTYMHTVDTHGDDLLILTLSNSASSARS